MQEPQIEQIFLRLDSGEILPMKRDVENNWTWTAPKTCFLSGYFVQGENDGEPFLYYQEFRSVLPARSEDLVELQDATMRNL